MQNGERIQEGPMVFLRGGHFCLNLPLYDFDETFTTFIMQVLETGQQVQGESARALRQSHK